MERSSKATGIGLGSNHPAGRKQSALPFPAKTWTGVSKNQGKDCSRLWARWATGAPRVTPSPSRVPSYPPPALHVFRTPQLRNNLPNVRASGSARKAPLFPCSAHSSQWGRAERTQRAKNFPAGESIFLLLLLRSEETGSYLDILSSFSESLEEFPIAVHTNIPPHGHLLMPLIRSPAKNARPD